MSYDLVHRSLCLLPLNASLYLFVCLGLYRLEVQINYHQFVNPKTQECSIKSCFANAWR